MPSPSGQEYSLRSRSTRSQKDQLPNRRSIGFVPPDETDNDEETDHEEGERLVDPYVDTYGLSINPSNILPAVVALILFVLLIGTTVYRLMWSPSIDPSTRSSLADKVRRLLDDLSIDEFDRDTVDIAVNRWALGLNGRHPSVIVFSGSSSASLISSITNTLQKEISGESGNVIKCEKNLERSILHSRIADSIESSPSPLSVVGLQNIERLSWDSPLVLHVFSDPESDFPSKPLILLSAHVRNNASFDCEWSIQSSLQSSWTESGGTMDSIMPIISRLLVFPICI